jgi:aminoglycoside phosphotransferase (APT) family kinase protein
LVSRRPTLGGSIIGEYVGYVRDQLGVRESSPAFRAFRLRGSNEVYAYEEKHSSAKVICKFYGPRYGWDRDRAAWTASQEYESLQRLRSFDLVGSPHHVIRPLGLERDINCVLALEFYTGEQFSHAIERSTRHHDDAHLFWRLKSLAYFLATQHNRTANGRTVDFDADCAYFARLVDRLRNRRLVGSWDVDELLWLQDLWHDRPSMWQDRQVWLHGDATPANFLFGHGLDVAAIDLERMKRGDRMFDVGRVAGEIQHAFMSSTGDRRRAEPFIGHFLWEYSCHFPDRYATFASISARVPYFMALNLLRIARNDYISFEYGRKLVRQSKRLLQAS